LISEIKIKVECYFTNILYEKLKFKFFEVIYKSLVIGTSSHSGGDLGEEIFTIVYAL